MTYLFWAAVELKTTLINLFSRICFLMNMAQRFFFFKMEETVFFVSGFPIFQPRLADPPLPTLEI